MPLKREQYNEIMRVINDRHYTALRLRDKRRDEIMSQFPALSIYDEEAARLRTDMVSARLGKGAKKTDEIKDKLRDIAIKKRVLIKNAGYEEEYLEVKYFCPKCGDTGYIGLKKCSCFKMLETELLNREAGLPADMGRENFKTLDLRRYNNDEYLEELLPGKKITQREYMKTITIPRIKKYLQEFENEGSHNIFMFGASGTGKTFLSSCIARELTERQHSVLYLRAGELFSKLEKQHFSKEEPGEAEGLTDKLYECELLILDDLGTEFSTKYTISELYNIISDRLSRGLSTIISTNLAMSQIRSRYDERIMSRFVGQYMLIPFYGRDLRV